MNTHLIDVLAQVTMTTREDGSAHLAVVFKRGTFEPAAEPVIGPDGKIAEDDEGGIVWDVVEGEGEFVPDQIDIFLPPSSATSR